MNSRKAGVKCEVSKIQAIQPKLLNEVKEFGKDELFAFFKKSCAQYYACMMSPWSQSLRRGVCVLIHFYDFFNNIIITVAPKAGLEFVGDPSNDQQACFSFPFLVRIW